MIDPEQWRQAVQIHIAALKLVLKNIFDQEYAVELLETELCPTKDAEEQMKGADIMVRFVEKEFQSEVCLGFSATWLDTLANHLLNEQNPSEEAGNKLITELSTNILEIFASALAEVGVVVEVTYLDTIRELSSATLNLQNYFTTHLQAEAPENDSKHSQPPLGMWMAVSQPAEEQLEDYTKQFEAKNPLEDENYSDSLAHFARHMNMGPNTNEEADYKGNVKMQGQKVEFEDFDDSKAVRNRREVRNIDILKNVEMHVSVELGHREMPLGNILQFMKGSVIELEKLAGEPVEILVNGHKIAQGDVVVIDEHFGVRISNLLASQERIKELQ